ISDSLANAFSRLGWIGFWIQIAIGIVPLTLIIYAFISGQSTDAGTRRGLLLVRYLTIAGFLVLMFTTMWFYRYTSLAERISDSTRRRLLATFRNRGPYPVLVLSGEQGSAKSTFSELLRALIDPNTAPLRALPREDRDLFIAANNGHVL